MKRTARCSCGQLMITVEGEPTGVGLCHCFECQRRTGSVFAALASFSGAVQVVGETKEFTRAGDAGARYTFSFCPVCGTNLFHREVGLDDSLGIAVGCFEDPGFPPPNVSVYDRRRHAWVSLPEDVVRYDRDPD